MSEENIQVKEWEKDIKMSYRPSYHRPHRTTWEDIEKMKDMLMNIRDEMADEEIDEFLDLADAVNDALEEDEAELERLESMDEKDLTEEDRAALDKLRLTLGRLPGALDNRDPAVLESIAGNRLPPEPVGVLRLHMELYSDYEEPEAVEVFRKYGGLKYGDNISRDVVVPADIPLYALHFAIQRVFGWQNSHLHQFELPMKRFNEFVSSAGEWEAMAGVLFRSPFMEESDEFWADDYSGGSFKNWLRKKYTGPYMSQCQGEGIIQCTKDMDIIDDDAEYYALFENFSDGHGGYTDEEILTKAYSVYDQEGKKRTPPTPWKEERKHRVEIFKFRDLPADGLRVLFERGPYALLERLPVSSVLAAGYQSLPDVCSAEERTLIDKAIYSTAEEFIEAVEEDVDEILESGFDSPLNQPDSLPVTDALIYNYDFGDRWMIRITASENCPDLVESGRISQAELDRANVKCREVYRPVLIARDGEMLIDDAGGICGFANFLETINPDLSSMDAEERAEARRDKKEYLEWAKGQGWHKEKITNFNLL